MAHPGDVVDDRFELLRIAGAGGMGVVFLALDRRSGEHVAVKVMLDARGPNGARFLREAEVLADLRRHPALVRYVAHGRSAAGEEYLAMEWLEGEDLAGKLARRALTVGETLALGARVAEALAAVHARGVVHRDLKPSNLFLVGGDVERVKVLDFGVARLEGGTRMTGTGTVVGTLGYMAPEQARSGERVDARADVFSLGCVLHECLTGTPVFAGEHVAAVLVKILFEEASRVDGGIREVPAALGDLIARMLAKDPEGRPRDGAAVAAALTAVADGRAAESPARPSNPPAALTRGERRLLSVVLLGGDRGYDVASAVTLDADAPDPALAELRGVAENHGGRLTVLADGSLVVVLAGEGIATDRAAQAARCALGLRASGRRRNVVLATGRGELTGRLPMSDAVDRGARLLSSRAAPTDDGPAPIAIDDITARLLDARFEVVETEAGPALVDEREAVSEARTLLGQATPCVGRDREIHTLATLFAECAEEEAPRAALVTAPAGYGKSRVAQELVRSLRQRGAPAQIWVGRGDPMRAGSALGLLGQALRAACGFGEGESLTARREKLGETVARLVTAADRARVTEFLGEIVGTPMPDEQSTPLRAARRDAQIMSEQLRRAWEDFLRASAASAPVLLVLEDLHWGDLATVRFVDAALLSLRDAPWMVLALARPEVRDRFPALWAERELLEMRLGTLPRRASERLVHKVLGARADAATVARLVTLADGHAFYLEELIRAVAEGKGDALPETVLAMVQARLEGLDDDARRALRAASVFGEAFWPGGVARLLGGALRPTRAGAAIEALIERELVVRRPASRFAGEEELAFRHALQREGAYAMLTDEDRALGHRLAAEWLEQAGEGDPMVLAEHWERGGNPARAGVHYLRGATQANRAGDTEATLARARRGLELAAAVELRVGLLGMLSEVHVWRSEWDAAVAYAEEALRLAPPDSVAFCQASGAKLGHALQHRQLDQFMTTLRALMAAEPAVDATATAAVSLGLATFMLVTMSQFELAGMVLARLDAIVAPVADRDPVARAWRDLSHTRYDAWSKGDPWLAFVRAEAARAGFLEADHQHGARLAQVFVGLTAWTLGLHERAEDALRDAAVAEGAFSVVASLGPFVRVNVLTDLGRLAEAERMIEAGRAGRSPPPHEGRGRWALGEVLLRLGDVEGAERETLAAIELLGILPLDRAAATAVLAACRLAQGRPTEAIEVIKAGGSTESSFGIKSAFVRLIHAEALHAAGRTGEARAAIALARARILSQAAKIPDEETRRAFLGRVPEHVRTIALGDQWDPG